MAKIFLIYLVAGLLAFANGLSGPFMLDDHAFFTPQIKDIRSLPQYFIPKVYKASESSSVVYGQPNFYYRPFAKVLPSISYAMFGQKFLLYHLFNLTLFVVAGFLLFRFLLGAGILGYRGSFLAGLFLIVHPINGLASVFAVQVIFMLGSMYCLTLGYERRRTREEGRKTKEIGGFPLVFGLRSLVSFFSRPSFFGLLCFVLALMCHETAMLLPLYAFVFLFLYGCFDGTFFQKIRACFYRTWFLWAALAAWLVFRFYYASLGDGLIAKFTRFEMNPFEYTASVGKITAWYLSRLIIPWDIVLIWATPVVRGGEALMWLTFGSLILGLWVFGLGRRIKDKTIRLGLWWLATGFLPLPVMCLFQPTHGVMIEPHWFVFSGIGFFICIARWAEVFTAVNDRSSNFGITVVIVIVALWIFAGWRHNHLWGDEKRYAHYWSQQAPSIKSVWFHLGEIYFKERRFSDSIGYYEQSIRNTYQDYLAYQRMGLSYFQLGDYRRADVNFMLSLGLEPRQPGIKERLAWIKQNAE
jgi:type III secretory pathway component EscS